MAASGIDLVDANVWLAIAVSGHVHHAVAKSWFDAQADGSCAFCRITQLALLRHLTNIKIMGSANVLTQVGAWQIYDSLLTDPRVLFVDEPTGIGPAFKSFTQLTRPAHKLWTDAYLAAFAMSSGLEVTTFDADLSTFSGLTVNLLTP